MVNFDDLECLLDVEDSAAEFNENECQLSITEVVELRQNLRDAYKTLLPAATELETEARNLAVELKRVRSDVSISRIVGSSVSLGAGVPLMIAGLTLAPFTFGISAILTGIGAGVSALGGLTAAGAQITESVISHQSIKHRIQGLQTNLTASLQRVSQCQLALKTNKRGLMAASGAMNNQMLQALALGLIKSVASAGRIGLCFADDAAKIARFGVSTASAVGHVVCQGALTAVAAVIDVYTIVDASLDTTVRQNSNATIESLLKAADVIRLERQIAEAYVQKNSPDADGASVIADVLRCCICHEVASCSPVRCMTCLAVVGCRVCIDEWLSKQSSLAMKPSCPLCRSEWPSEKVEKEQLLEGFDEVLNELKMNEFKNETFVQ